MQKARQDLNMKQSDLATKVNEKVRSPHHVYCQDVG